MYIGLQNTFSAWTEHVFPSNCSSSVMLRPQKGGSSLLCIEQKTKMCISGPSLEFSHLYSRLPLKCCSCVTLEKSCVTSLSLRRHIYAQTHAWTVLQLWLAVNSNDPDLIMLADFLAWLQACLIPKGLPGALSMWLALPMTRPTLFRVFNCLCLLCVLIFRLLIASLWSAAYSCCSLKKLECDYACFFRCAVCWLLLVKLEEVFWHSTVLFCSYYQLLLKRTRQWTGILSGCLFTVGL